ncbi:MAG: hypothetical protein OHK0026_17070 [Rhodocyclaceae bacterium]
MIRNDKPRTVFAAILPDLARGVVLSLGVGLAVSAGLAAAVLLLASHASGG